MRDQKPSLADLMYPSLSRESKEREAATAAWHAEIKRRNERLAEDLRGISRRMRERSGER